MKQFFSQYRKCLRFYSSFLQIFSILFLIISMTLGIFFVYVFRQENHNLQQAAEHSYLNILESTSTTLELTMQNLQQIMLDTIWTSDFTNALVVPFDDTYDRTRNILEHLQQLVDVLQVIVILISAAFFLIMLLYSFDLLQSMRETGRVSAALGIPYFYIYLSTTVGFALALFRTAQRIWRALAGHFKKGEVLSL